MWSRRRFGRCSHGRRGQRRADDRAGRPEMLAPNRQAKAWTLVPHFARRTVSSASDASLRLTAQEDDEIRALAGLRAQRLVRDDQRRPRRRHLGDTKDLRRNHNAVECGFRVARFLRCRLALRASARPRTSVHHVAVRTPAFQGDDAPSYVRSGEQRQPQSSLRCLSAQG
jgi:hypothetical protein